MSALSLLSRAQAGDPRALEILLRRYLPRVTRLGAWAGFQAGPEI